MGKKSRQKTAKRKGGFVVTPQQTAQQQIEQATLKEIAQYVGVKWGRPVVMVLFGGPGAATFQTLTLGEPGESQFLIAGAELEAMGKRVQGARLDMQFKVTVQQR